MGKYFPVFWHRDFLKGYLYMEKFGRMVVCGFE